MAWVLAIGCRFRGDAMAKTCRLVLRPYLPWWFKAYLNAVHVFAWMIGMEADSEKLSEQARKAVRFRKLEVQEDLPTQQ